MKKYLSFLTMALLAVVFYSCEDVPAPYEINNNGKNPMSSTVRLLPVLSESGRT